MDGERTFLACGSLRLATTGLFWKGREGRDCGSAWFRLFQWWVHPQFASFGCFVGQINIVRRGRGTTREPRVLPMRINRAIRGCAVESAVPSRVPGVDALGTAHATTSLLEDARSSRAWHKGH